MGDRHQPSRDRAPGEHALGSSAQAASASDALLAEVRKAETLLARLDQLERRLVRFPGRMAGEDEVLTRDPREEDGPPMQAAEAVRGG